SCFARPNPSGAETEFRRAAFPNGVSKRPGIRGPVSQVFRGVRGLTMAPRPAVTPETHGFSATEFLDPLKRSLGTRGSKPRAGAAGWLNWPARLAPSYNGRRGREPIQTEGAMRGYHDIGGLPAGPIDRCEHDKALWEKRVHALLVLLSG